MTRLKGLLLLAVMLVCANQMQAQTQMQIEFEKFIEKFPKKEWKDLRNIQRLTMDDLQKYQKVSAAEANRNIWYEEPQFGPNNIYNHVKEEHIVIDYKYHLSGPIIKLNESENKSCYNCALLGRYYESEDDEVYAIARLEPFDDVVILVVGYKYADDTRTFRFAIDAFSFRRSTQQMCSGVELLGAKSFNPIATSLLYDNYIVHSYEYYEGTVEEILNRYVYRFESDGFFYQLNGNEDIIYSYSKVSDPDGYVNVRKDTNVNSEVLYTVKDGCDVFVWQIPGTNWAEVVSVRDDSRMSGGYIHMSRLKFIEKRY